MAIHKSAASRFADSRGNTITSAACPSTAHGRRGVHRTGLRLTPPAARARAHLDAPCAIGLRHLNRLSKEGRQDAPPTVYRALSFLMGAD